MKKLSVKLRVTLWYTIIVTVVSAVVFVAMLSVSRGMIEHDVSDRVEREVSDIAHVVASPDGRMRIPPNFRFYKNGVHMVILDSENNIVYGHLPFEISQNIELKGNYLRVINENGERYYTYTKELLNTGMWLRGVVSVTDETEWVRTVTRNNLILTSLLIIISAIGGYFIVKRALVPVSKISATAKRISESSDLSQRINLEGGGDEIYGLAKTFDEMLDKIEQTFEREKQFTSDASHELRTPAAVIISECEYMEECAKTEEEFKESAESIKRQAERMSKLISELLMISRMDKNTVKLNFESMDISELVTFVCDEQREIHDESITLNTEIENGITAEADRFLLVRLFINLISNAYQYGKEGGNINVRLFEKDGNIVFSVQDDGIGISEKDIPKIWERFYQADSSRTDNGSMGLGLSMVKWIANCHGGEITVKSELGKGSTFTFTFPKGGSEK